MEKEAFDAVEMVRRIRDAHYEQTKNMTPEVQLAFYHDKGRQAQVELEQFAQKRRAK